MGDTSVPFWTWSFPKQGSPGWSYVRCEKCRASSITVPRCTRSPPCPHCECWSIAGVGAASPSPGRSREKRPFPKHHGLCGCPGRKGKRWAGISQDICIFWCYLIPGCWCCVLASRLRLRGWEGEFPYPMKNGDHLSITAMNILTPQFCVYYWTPVNQLCSQRIGQHPSINKYRVDKKCHVRVSFQKLNSGPEACSMFLIGIIT